MSKNKQKIEQKPLSTRLMSAVVLVAFLANLIGFTPAHASFWSGFGLLANFSEKLGFAGDVEEFTLKASPQDKMFNPVTGSVPDKEVLSVITAYTSTPDQTDDTPDIAAWGDHVYDGMIAANWLPRNTKIKIPALFGDKVFTVSDRMNARYGYGRLDIWMDSSKDEAFKFGVKRAVVEVYYPDKPNKVEKLLATAE